MGAFALLFFVIPEGNLRFSYALHAPTHTTVISTGGLQSYRKPQWRDPQFCPANIPMEPLISLAFEGAALQSRRKLLK